MEEQYLVVESNVVTNTVIWDGNTQTWTPPADATMLVQSTTPAMVWELNSTVKPPVYQLVQVMGVGDIGFTWDGTVLTTNEPQPTLPTAAANQPITTGTKAA
jgi:hypothetical protein